MLIWLGPDRAANVVDEHVDAAEGVECGLHGMLGACVGFQIRRDSVRLTAGCGDFGLHFVDQFGAVHQQRLGTLFCRRQCNAAPDALRRPSHDDGLA